MTYSVSISPHVHSGKTTQKIMLDVIIALIPTLLASALIFGWRSLLLTAVSVSACVFFEFLWTKLMKLDVTVGDLSAVVTGIIIAFNIPVSLPIWQLIIGDASAIIVAKMLFGGLGCNFMNPALVGRIVMFFSFTGSMTDYSGHITPFASKLFSDGADLITGATPLSAEALDMSDLGQLFLGVHGGVLGETCALTLLLGGIYLVVRRVITPTIPLTFILGTVLFSLIFGDGNAILSAFSGGVMLGAVFMATDYVTSPNTETGKFVFALGAAFLTVAIRSFSSNAEGVSFAILLMNVLVPYIDMICKTKPLGAIKVGKSGGAKK